MNCFSLTRRRLNRGPLGRQLREASVCRNHADSKKGVLTVSRLSRQVLRFMVLTLLALGLLGCSVTISPPQAPVTQVIPVTQVVPVTPTAATNVVSKKFEVSALGWKDTGIVISAGDWVQISVTGGGWTTWAGVNPRTDGNGIEGRRDPCTPMPDHNTGGLVGQIGDNPPLWVGNDVALRPSPFTGDLKLSMNDCSPFGGNEGSLTVNIAVMKP